MLIKLINYDNVKFILLLSGIILSLCSNVDVYPHIFYSPVFLRDDDGKRDEGRSYVTNVFNAVCENRYWGVSLSERGVGNETRRTKILVRLSITFT